MLFVYNHKAQIVERQQYGRACAHHNLSATTATQSDVGFGAGAGGKARGVDRKSVTKGPSQTLDKLLGKGQLGHKVQHRATFGQSVGCQRNIHFGFAAARNSVEQYGLVAREVLAHRVECCGLSLGEGGVAD